MPSLESYWKSKRRYAIVVFISLPVVGLLLAVSVLAVWRLGDWLFTAWNTSGTGDRLDILSFVSSTLLTAILVVATCVYAWLTWRLVREGVESRRMSSQPVLLVDFDEFNIEDSGMDGGMIMSGGVRVLNRGAGPAFVLAAEAVFPYGPKAKEEDPWLLNAIRVQFPRLPTPFQSGETAAGRVVAHVAAFRLPEGRFNEFTRVDLKYEDRERNLYVLTETYHLSRVAGRNYLGLAYQRLELLPFRKRRYVTDGSLGIFHPDDPLELIHERITLL